MGAVNKLIGINGAGSFSERAYQDELRQAALEAVNAADIQAMVAKQIELAKGGDRHALKWVTDVVLGAGKPLSVRATQHNYYDQHADHSSAMASAATRRPPVEHCPPDPTLSAPAPTTARAGTDAKVDVLAQRYASRQELFIAEDGPGD